MAKDKKKTEDKEVEVTQETRNDLNKKAEERNGVPGSNRTYDPLPTGNKNGSDNQSSSNSGSGSTGGNKKTEGTNPAGDYKPQNVKKMTEDAINDYMESIEANDKIINGANEDRANSYGINTKNGDSEYYTSLPTLNKERKEAEDKLDEAIKNNPVISENRALKNTYQTALEVNKNIKKEAKKQAKAFGKKLKPLEKEQAKLEAQRPEKTAEQLEIEAESANKELADANYAIQEFQKSKEWIDNVGDPTLQKKMKDLAEAQAQVTQKRNDLLEQYKTAEEWEKNWGELEGQVKELKDMQANLLSGNVKSFIEWADLNGSDDDKAKAKILSAMTDSIMEADEDGILTDEEKENILNLMQGCEDAINAEKKSNSAIVDAQKTYDNARDKFMYFLFDQIKSIAVLMVGLSAGNASMVYSALDNFNKTIADSEAGYRTNVIKAFANNTYKNITGDADAQYAMKLLIPELKKSEVFMQLDSQKQAYLVKGLEQAFEEYQSYVNTGGKNDFAAWFAAQQNNNSSSEVVKLITTLISIGALNSNTLKDFFEKWVNGGEKPATNNNNGAKKPVSLINGSRLNLGEMYGNAMTKGVPSAQEQQNLINNSRDKQTVVNSAVASHMPQGGTQGSPLAMTNNRGRPKAV